MSIETLHIHLSECHSLNIGLTRYSLNIETLELDIQ